MLIRPLSSVAALFIAALLPSAPAAAQATCAQPLAQAIAYQGVFTFRGVAEPPTGPFVVAFALWDRAEGGEAIWSDVPQSVAVERGVFSAYIGCGRGLPQIPDAAFLSIGVGIDATAAVTSAGRQTPRTPLTAAFRSRLADVAAAVAPASVGPEGLRAPAGTATGSVLTFDGTRVGFAALPGGGGGGGGLTLPFSGTSSEAGAAFAVRSVGGSVAGQFTGSSSAAALTAEASGPFATVAVAQNATAGTAAIGLTISTFNVAAPALYAATNVAGGPVAIFTAPFVGGGSTGQPVVEVLNDGYGAGLRVNQRLSAENVAPALNVTGRASDGTVARIETGSATTQATALTVSRRSTDARGAVLALDGGARGDVLRALVADGTRLDTLLRLRPTGTLARITAPPLEAGARFDGTALHVRRTVTGSGTTLVLEGNTFGYLLRGIRNVNGFPVVATTVTPFGDYDTEGRYRTQRRSTAQSFLVVGVCDFGDVMEVVGGSTGGGVVRVQRSTAYATQRVVGVCDPDAGVVMGFDPERAGTANVAVAGVVPVRIDTANSVTVVAGDLLVSAPDGRVNPASQPDPGTVVGKALTGGISGQQIQMLLMLR